MALAIARLRSRATTDTVRGVMLLVLQAIGYSLSSLPDIHQRMLNRSSVRIAICNLLRSDRPIRDIVAVLSPSLGSFRNFGY
jgi:hypothetical protein